MRKTKSSKASASSNTIGAADVEKAPAAPGFSAEKPLGAAGKVDAAPAAAEGGEELPGAPAQDDVAPAPRVPKAPPATSEATRHSMQGNRSKNTRPELVVRTYLRAAGLSGYRLQWKPAAGRPDVAFPGRRVAIFVHGCFWHRCPYCNPSRPRSNVEFWEAKFRRNRERDERDARELLARGWTVIVVWECRLKKKRLRRTMDEVVAEVRATPVVRVKADVRPGKLIVLGRTYVRGPRGLAAQRVRARRHARA